MPTPEEILRQAQVDRLARSVGAPPEPKDLDRMLPKLARDARTGEQLTQHLDLEGTARRARERFADSPFAGEVGLQLEHAQRRVQAARGAPRIVESVAGRRPAAPRGEVRTNLERDVDFLVGAGRSALQGAMTVLDTPARVARHTAVAAMDPETDFEPGRAFMAREDLGSTARFDERTRALAEEGNVPAQAVSGVMSGLSHVAQPVGAALGATPAASLDVAAETLGQAFRGEPLEAARQLPGRALEAGERVFDIAFNDPEARANTRRVVTALATDPLMYVGGSLKGASQVALRQGVRIAQRAGLNADDAARAGQALADIAAGMHTPDDLVEQTARVGQWATEFGIRPEQVQQVLGPTAEFLGKGQVTVGPQLAGARGQIEVADAVSRLTRGKVQAPEQLVRRTAEEARTIPQRVVKAITRSKDPIERPVPAHQRLAVREAARTARVEAAQGTRAANEDWIQSVAPLTPPTARAKELLRHHVDPDYRVLEGGAVEQVGKFIPRDELTPAEQAWVDAMRDFYARRGEALAEAGVIDKSARNPVSGMFVPRQFEPKLTTAEGIRHRLSTSEKPFRGSDSLKRRGEGGGRPLGRDFGPGLTAELDPSTIAVRYNGKIERTMAQERLSMWLADRFGEIPNTHPLHQRAAYQRMHNSSGQEVLVPQNVMSLAKHAEDRAFRTFRGQLIDRALSWFKEFNTMPVPRYHIVNMSGDTFMMYVSGMRDPRRFADAQRVLGNAPNDAVAVMTPTGPIRVGEARELLRKAGIMDDPSHGVARFDIDATRTQATATRTAQTAARKGQRQRGELDDLRATRWLKDIGPGEAFKDVASIGVPGFSLRRPMRALASKWDETSKTALFLDRLAKGDGAMQARTRVFDTLFDYADHDGITRWFRRFFPFGTYTSKAIRAIPKQLARQPHAASLSQHASQALIGEPEGGPRDDPAPSFQAEMAGTQALGAPQREAVSSMAEALTGEPIDPAFGMSLRVRDPVTEGMTPLLELVSGNPDPFALGMNPFLGAGLEFLSEQDLLTKRPLERARPTSMFPAGTPGVPAGLEAAPGQAAWLTRYAPQFLMSPLAVEFANTAIGKTVLGRHRQRAIAEDNRQALRLINLLLGLPLSLTTGTEGLSNAAFDPRVERAGRTKQTITRELKRERRRERVQGQRP